MKSSIFIILALTLVSCGPRRPGKLGQSGAAGVSSGIDIADANGACSNGGVILSSFKDYNNDGILDLNEPVNSVKTVCNGIDGQNSSVNLASLDVGSLQCPNGGVLISSSSSSSIAVCNGIDGLNGEQGLQGLIGLPGIAGPVGPQGPAGLNGSTVTPIKFCSESTADFPEYGLKVGDDVFAVYFNQTHAFLAKLIPHQYTTTTGTQDCNFTIL